MQTAKRNVPSLLSDEELLAAITHNLRSIYADVIRQPLPEALDAALKRLEARAVDEKPRTAGGAGGVNRELRAFCAA